MIEVTTTDGLRLAASVGGPRGAPTVVLVHGFPDCSRVWDEVAERLEGTFRVVTYDVRGAGVSDVPARTRDYRFERLADDLVAVADAVSLEAPVHVVGHDWGAIQSFEAVCSPTHARRIASFTCISGASFDHAGRRLRAQLRPSLTPWRGVGDVARQLGKSWYIGMFQLPAVPERVLRSPLGRRLVDALEEVPPRDGHPADTFTEDAVNGVNLYRANVGRVARPVRDHVGVPTQVVVGDHDPFVSLGLFDELAHLSPKGAWLRVVRGGHWLPRSHPDVLARAITDLVVHVEDGPDAASPEFRRARLDRHDRRGWHGRLAVVTGAGNGIGRATALAFAERGAQVVLVDLDPDAAERTATFARHHDVAAHVHVADVADAEGMEGLVKDVVATHGVPDVVVNNAGIGMAGTFLDTSDEDWQRILGVNLWGVIRGSRLFAQAMVDAGRPGHVVNLSSGLAFLPAREMSAYATTKAAVLMLSEVLRNEFADHGIGVSAICPGVVDTGITDRTRFVGVDEDEQSRRRRAATSLYRRRAYGPARVADAIVAAVEQDRAVVPVTPEAVVGRWLGRLSPSLVRRLADLDVVPR